MYNYEIRLFMKCDNKYVKIQLGSTTFFAVGQLKLELNYSSRFVHY